MEIPLRRKYTDVSNGRFRSPANNSGVTRPRMEKTQRQKTEAEAARRRVVPYLLVPPRGRARMVKPAPKG